MHQHVLTLSKLRGTKYQVCAMLLREDMELSIDACKTPCFTITRIYHYSTNRSICNSSGGKSSLMAGKRGERVVSALNSLSSDGLCLPGEEDKVEALIGEYFFTDSADENGSDESDNESVIICTYSIAALCAFPYVGFLGWL